MLCCSFFSLRSSIVAKSSIIEPHLIGFLFPEPLSRNKYRMCIFPRQQLEATLESLITYSAQAKLAIRISEWQGQAQLTLDVSQVRDSRVGTVELGLRNFWSSLSRCDFFLHLRSSSLSACFRKVALNMFMMGLKCSAQQISSSHDVPL
jgi:hypothetical protein